MQWRNNAMGKPKRRWAWVRTPQIFSSILFYSNYIIDLFQFYWKFLVERCRARCRPRRGRVEETEAPVSSGTLLMTWPEVAKVAWLALESNSRTAQKQTWRSWDTVPLLAIRQTATNICIWRGYLWLGRSLGWPPIMPAELTRPASSLQDRQRHREKYQTSFNAKGPWIDPGLAHQ
jgi:hypothetical protein